MFIICNQNGIFCRHGAIRQMHGSAPWAPLAGDAFVAALAQYRVARDEAVAHARRGDFAKVREQISGTVRPRYAAGKAAVQSLAAA